MSLAYGSLGLGVAPQPRREPPWRPWDSRSVGSRVTPFPSALFQQYAPLLAVFSSQGQSELVLLQKVQEYCYDNIHFMKAFQKIVVLFYKGTVASHGCALREP